MRFAICNEIFQGWRLDDAMRHAASIGYDAIEIAPFTLAPLVTDISATERIRIRDAAARHGIGICGLHWVLAQTEGMYLTHNDASIRRRTSKYFCELVNCCADLGGNIIVIGSPKQRNLLPGVTQEQAGDWAIETLRDSVHAAQERKVTLCIEPLSPAETNFITTAADAMLFAERFASSNFKIILDVKAMSSEPHAIAEIIRASWPHFVHFHANDKNLKGPGFGDVDFKPIAAALHEVGYNGFVSVEVFKFEEGPETIAGKSIEYLKRSFGENGL